MLNISVKTVLRSIAEFKENKDKQKTFTPAWNNIL